MAWPIGKLAMPDMARKEKEASDIGGQMVPTFRKSKHVDAGGQRPVKLYWSVYSFVCPKGLGFQIIVTGTSFLQSAIALKETFTN